MAGVPVRFLGGLVLVAASFLLPPTALAAPPGNDDFEDAQTLAGALPSEVSATNVGATKETEEPFHGFSSAGKSVWFEWEATTTGFVTVGACDSDFPAVVGVYSGASLASLTKVAEGNSSEGPQCPFMQRQFTFAATSGTTYRIVVDGNSFFPPGAPKPVTEGEFTLRIEDTPTPTNDDFQDAADLSEPIAEEPGGDRFLAISAFGFNWDATKEPGEPDHAGDPGGASVWYAWTAPESGPARIGACCSSSNLLDVYVGGALGALIPLEPVPSPPFGTVFPVVAGTTYRIAVDGKLDVGTGASTMGSFNVMISMSLSPLSKDPSPLPEGQSASLDDKPPSTAIRRRKVWPSRGKATFAFVSGESRSIFRCKLDRRPFTDCRSPKTYRNVTPGRHAFKVFAIDAAGNADRSPAVARFRIAAPPQRSAE